MVNFVEVFGEYEYSFDVGGNNFKIVHELNNATQTIDYTEDDDSQ